MKTRANQHLARQWRRRSLRQALLIGIAFVIALEIRRKEALRVAERKRLSLSRSLQSQSAVSATVFYSAVANTCCDYAHLIVDCGVSRKCRCAARTKSV